MNMTQFSNDMLTKLYTTANDKINNLELNKINLQDQQKSISNKIQDNVRETHEHQLFANELKGVLCGRAVGN